MEDKNISKKTIEEGSAVEENTAVDNSDTINEEDIFTEISEEEKFNRNKTRIMNMLKPEIDIAWMYPDTLYLHGERGNVMALVRYAQRLGLVPKVHRIDLGTEDFDPMEYDILFYGPGEISSFKSVMEDIGKYKRSIAEYIASGKVMLVTGSTVAMFGERIRRFDPDAEDGRGEVIDGLCIIPAIAEEREYVFGDDLYVSAEYGGYSMGLIGNQIHMADIEFFENSNYSAFASVIYGRGNNGEDGKEGVVYNNSIFTNMLGPVLVGNPWLTVRLLRAAAELKNITIFEPDPRYLVESRSFELKRQFIEEKSDI